jgi:hypothetical protein
MTVFVIIFMIVASIFAIASLVYVVTDIILEVTRNKEEPVAEPEPEPIPEPEPEPEPIIIPVIIPEPEPEPEPEPVIEIVEQIDAVEADELITDEVAMSVVRYEEGAGHGKKGIVNLGIIDKTFEAGSLITIAELKKAGLLAKSFGRVKILADGVLTKSFTIKAEDFSVQAIKMIELTGGIVIILKED